jgi:hypothetical protein
LYASCTTLFTVDTAKPSSRANADKLCQLSYLLIILIFISKSMAAHLRNRSLSTSVADLPPAVAQLNENI